MLSFDGVIALVGQWPDLGLVAIDGLPLAGKTTLADRLATVTGAACVSLDDFIKPEREWRWRDRPSFPFDYIRYDEFMGAVVRLAIDGECRYRPWDYRTGERADAEVVVRRTGPVIVEGVSALHVELGTALRSADLGRKRRCHRARRRPGPRRRKLGTRVGSHVRA